VADRAAALLLAVVRFRRQSWNGRSDRIARGCAALAVAACVRFAPYDNPVVTATYASQYFFIERSSLVSV